VPNEAVAGGPEICATPAPVALLTGWGLGHEGEAACHPFSINGRLVADSKSGTAIDVTKPNYLGRMPVMWLPGSVGLRVGSEVEVLDPSGVVVATTGKNYEMCTGDGYAFGGGGAAVPLPSP
jgi:hypothetical protein